MFAVKTVLLVLCYLSVVSQCSFCPGQESIWNIHIHNENFPPYATWRNQRATGFLKDLVNRVCLVAGKNCQITVDHVRSCWASKSGERGRGGKGLMSGWYDACVGFVQTHQRTSVFSFTRSFYKQEGIYGLFYVKIGNPRSFDPTDIRYKKLGFVEGAFIDHNCIARHAEIIGARNITKDQIKYFSTIRLSKEAVINETIDALFFNLGVSAAAGLERIGEPITDCAVSGMSVMTRKDSCLATWWNNAFENLKESGEFAKLCKQAAEKYGADPSCDI